MLLFRAFFEELDAVLRDMGVLLIFVGGLMIYSMSYPLPYSSQVVHDVPVVVVDQDDTALSRKLLRWVDATEEVGLSHEAESIEEAERLVRDGAANGVFLIPEGFENDVLRGKQTTVSAYADVTYFMLYRKVMTGLIKASATLSAGVEIKRMTASGSTEAHALNAREPVPVADLPLFNPVSGYASYVVPGVFPIVIQQTLLIGLGMLGGTRRERWKAAPPKARIERCDSLLAVLIGRTMAYFAIYWPYPLFYVGVIYYVYDLPHPGSMSTVMLFSVPYVLSIALFGQTLNVFLKEREHSLMVIVGTAMPFVFLAGFAWPIDAQPAWLHYFGLLVPSTSGVPGFLRINQMNASLQEVYSEWKALWGLCGLYFVLAYLGLWITGAMRLRPGKQGRTEEERTEAETESRTNTTY